MSRRNLAPGPTESAPTLTPPMQFVRRERVPLPARLAPRSYLVNAGRGTPADAGQPDDFGPPGSSTTAELDAAGGGCCG